MKKLIVAGILALMPLSALADDCYEEAREERREHCSQYDDECHEHIDRELKRCLAREGRERGERSSECEHHEPIRSMPSYQYIPQLPQQPITVMPGWN